MNIVVCCPSYHRPKVETLRYLPKCRVYVSNEELEAYQQENPGADIVGVDPKHQGNVCRIRNHILDLNKDNVTCIIDDDLRFMGCWENRQAHKLSEEEFYAFVYKYTVMALDLGVFLWGVNVNQDKQVYREYTPFSLLSYIGSPFMVHLPNPIRFDERFSLKEDYDITLQHLNKYRKVLRVNRYFYSVRQCEQTGGCATYRNVDKELAQIKTLQLKWGADIVKLDSNNRSHNSSKVKRFDINPVIHAPLKGV